MLASLKPLARMSRSDLAVLVLDAEGAVTERHGFDDGVSDRAQLGTDGVAPGGRRHLTAHGVGDGSIVLTYPDEIHEAWSEFLEALLESLRDRAQLEVDLESMSASSLALLEEAAMVGEVMAELSRGETDEDVVVSGLSSLIVGASCARAIYFAYQAASDQFEFVSHIEYDSKSRRGQPVDYTGVKTLDPIGVLGRAITAEGAVLEGRAPDADALGEPGTPEHLADREVLAVPVRHGDDGQGMLLGVMLLLDKREMSYSSVTEFGSHETKLATALASMLAAVLGARLSAALGKELKMATMIQQQILPERPAKVAGFDLAGRCQTSGAVGGDYFDFLPMADGRTLCVVADVSGHNLASGMVMVSARAALKLLASKLSDSAEVFNDLAAATFSDLSRTERFITAAGVALSEGESSVELVNAGHNDTMVFRAATGAVDRIESEETVLGFLPNVEYTRSSLELAAGDVVILYTDGITEATDSDDEMFGEERLSAVLAAHAENGSAQEILDAVYGAVDDFADESSGTDDITAVVVKYLGDPANGEQAS